MYHLCFPHSIAASFHAGSTWKSISSSYSSEGNCDQLEITFKLTFFSEQSETRHVLMAHLYTFTESALVLSRAFCCHLKPSCSHTADCITLHKPEIFWVSPLSSDLSQNIQRKSESMPPADSATLPSKDTPQAWLQHLCDAPQPHRMLHSLHPAKTLHTPVPLPPHITSLWEEGLGTTFKTL